MLKISCGLGPTGDCESSRHVARSQPSDLRKDEPHPMAAFAAGVQLGQHPVEDRRLRIHKALEIVVISAHDAP